MPVNFSCQQSHQHLKYFWCLAKECVPGGPLGPFAPTTEVPRSPFSPGGPEGGESQVSLGWELGGLNPVVAE